MTRSALVDTKDLVQELRRETSAEVRFDSMSRALYSTDASMYEMEPVGVVIPRTFEDVAATVDVVRRHSGSLLPRGGGTSLAGQTVARAVVIDFSKYMRSVLEECPEEGWVRVEPGIILDELNRHIRGSGRMFTPDPSTSNRGTVGGAIGNNSCGAHSIIWGKTVDNVCELEVILPDGSTARFGALSEGQFKSTVRAGGVVGEIAGRLAALGESCREEVEARFPKIMRRVGGYNLDELTAQGPPDLARFVVGSEGTLLTVTSAVVKTVPIPKFRGLAVVHFGSLHESMEATVAALELDPAAVEHIGSMILSTVRSNLAYSRMMDFVEGEPDSLLAVEFVGDSESEVTAQMDRLERRFARSGLGYAVVKMTKATDQARVWNVRKAGLGLMMNVPGDAKPLAFVEDTAVAPELLPEYVRRFDEIVRDHNTEAGYYGHASVGCLHIRPLVDLKLQEGVDRMVSIASAVSDLVLEFGGAMSAEHGDGLVRSVWNEKMFGPKIYEAFREVKRIFDPDGIMNPGKIVDPPPMTENLRISPAYRPLMVKTGLDFGSENGFAGAIERCNGQGACRKLSSGAMCPSYMATMEEEHSTRGRANALRAVISGILPSDALTSRRMYDVLDLCLECKACKAECPSNVDMAKLKYEFLHLYRKANGLPFRARMIGSIARINSVGSRLAPLSNIALRSAPLRRLMESVTGIDRRRQLPAFARQTFRHWFRSRQLSQEVGELGTAALYVDTFTDYNHPEIGKAAVNVLDRLGYRVVVPDTVCCGRPMLSAGMMDKARENALKNVESLYPFAAAGARIVGLEPSCTLAISDDYRDLVGTRHETEVVRSSTVSFDRLVEEALSNGSRSPFASFPEQIRYFGHCHQKALTSTASAMSVLRHLSGEGVTEIDAGCCGMAGSFGMTVDRYDLSMRIGEDRLFPAVRETPSGTVIVSDGVSCREQILEGTGREARHLAQVLEDSL